MKFTSKELKPGQQIRCIRDVIYGSIDRIEAGRVYKIKEVRHKGKLLLLEYPPYLYQTEHFAPLVARDRKGRFISTTPAKTTTTTFRKPTKLKNGALYGVKRKRGRVVARLRSVAKVAKQNYGVFTAHNSKPFLAPIDKVTLAEQNEVKEYLKH